MSQIDNLPDAPRVPDTAPEQEVQLAQSQVDRLTDEREHLHNAERHHTSSVGGDSLRINAIDRELADAEDTLERAELAAGHEPGEGLETPADVRADAGPDRGAV